MPLMRCPGQAATMTPTPQEARCPNCGTTVEVWSNDEKFECPACGYSRSMDTLPNCALWCEKAKECFGERMDELKCASADDK